MRVSQALGVFPAMRFGLTVMSQPGAWRSSVRTFGKDLHYLHFVLRERPGFVGADHGGRADRLACHELPNQ